LRRNHKKNVTVRNPCSYRKNIRNIATKGCAGHIFAHIKRPGRPDQTRNQNWKVGEKMGEVIVSMKDIVKTFPGVKALDHVNFELRSGEVMALLGENGAGKSTLMKILSGVYTKDSGTMTIFGTEYDNLTPKQAQDVGVAIIHQELNMCRHLSVAENMFLGREKVNGIVLNDREMEAEAAKILGDLKIDIDPRQTVGDLPVSKQQMVEIAKALSIHAKILIMDEPTSSLTAKEIEELFRIIRQLKADGCGIVYISHRLEELKAIVDRVTIMRDGQYITDGNFADMTMEQIIANMVGREIKEQFPRVSCPKGKKIFEVKNLNAGHLVRDINFSLYEGEIVGFAGLMGAGRTETTRAIFGVDPKTSGEIWLDGKEVKITCPMDAIKAGIVLAPEDRKKDGLCTKLSIRHNLALPNLDLICSKLGVISSKKEDDLCEKAVKDLLIKTPTVEVNAGNLSGGNQQKVVVGKWLARNSRVVIFDEPTRGIDVGAKVEIYNLMNQLKKQGIAVMFVSSEMPEVLGIADRVIVMCDGKITGEVMAKETSQNEVLKFATEFEKKQQVS
jgi:ribose transport system ATP-binding protein